MDSTVNVALVGIGGYGTSYLNALLDEAPGHRARLVAVVDPAASQCPRLGEIRDPDVVVHGDVSTLYARPSPRVDLTVVATPIHWHASHTRLALANGSNVLCEKPLAATPEDAVAVCEAERRSGRFVAVGFQWSFSRAVQRLKADVRAGTLGRPQRLRTLVIFPRGQSYFRRNAWAGRTHAPADGRPVFDSPLNNATAHYLHNMLYLLGDARETAARPEWVEAELYRANDIESFDTAALRCRMPGADGPELLFYTTHAAPERVGPLCDFEFEHARVSFDHADGARFVARFLDGRTIDYGQPEADRPQKLWQSVEAVRTGGPVACGARAALPHALCVAAARASSGGITAFPEARRRSDLVGGEPMTWIDRLDVELNDSYTRGLLPAEASFPWARAPSRRVGVSPFIYGDTKSGRRHVQARGEKVSDEGLEPPASRV